MKSSLTPANHASGDALTSQQKIVDVLRQRASAGQIPPNISELVEATGMDRSTLRYHVSHMARLGILKKIDGTATTHCQRVVLLQTGGGAL